MNRIYIKLLFQSVASELQRTLARGGRGNKERKETRKYEEGKMKRKWERESVIMINGELQR